MDPFTLALAIVAALSEIVPLLGCTRANGVLHGLQNLMIYIHADSECHTQVDVGTHPGAAEGPAAIAAVAVTPP